ncbi:MAG: hypothetical protein M1822_005186 [Bathelium mastoideum]|nr:MAG: hypothetical protein M1822_005186 [Bathelium mastoideum]
MTSLLRGPRLLRIGFELPSSARASPIALQVSRWRRSYATTKANPARTCIITGSSRGIGKAIALRLANDGYDICVNDVEANKAGVDEVVSQIRSTGRNAIPYLCDVSSLSAVTDMVRTSADMLGPLHTMIANAGIAQVKPLLELSEEDVQRMMAVNFFGVFNCYTAAAKQMIAQGPPPPAAAGGAGAETPTYKIIGAASIVAFKPFALLGHYSASKWAVRGLTQAMAMEVAGHGIRVNAYAPGIVGTAMWELIDENMGKIKGAKKGETIRKYSDDLIALGRTSVPEDVAKLVSFLASEDSEYVTGQTMIVDGGIQFT